MIKLLNTYQRYCMLEALENCSWKGLAASYNLNCTLGNKKGWKKRDLRKNSTTEEIGDVFEKLGWIVPDSHWIIGIKKPSFIIKDFLDDLKYWINYDLLKKPLMVTIQREDGSTYEKNLNS